MIDSDISTEEIESYQDYVGRSITETEAVGTHVCQRMSAALDTDDTGSELPPLWHYGLFLTQVGTSQLGSDGHPPRGDFLPPVSLPRRMFAGAAIKLLRPLTVGQDVTRVSRIASIDHRRGKSGHLVFVRVGLTFSQNGEISIEEEQTIVYRGAGARTPPVLERQQAPLAADEKMQEWTPTSVELFRYSCATFNSHRIHYDLPYAMEEEGYPGLVVHGPLTATRLCAFAAKIAGKPMRNFDFRGEAPAFANQTIRLIGRLNGNVCAVRAERPDGVVAMSATAMLG